MNGLPGLGKMVAEDGAAAEGLYMVGRPCFDFWSKVFGNWLILASRA